MHRAARLTSHLSPSVASSPPSPSLLPVPTRDLSHFASLDKHIKARDELLKTPNKGFQQMLDQDNILHQYFSVEGRKAAAQGQKRLKGATIFITGASRGIGLAIALRCAKDGANIVIAAKTTEQQKNLPGTIFSAAEEVEKAGGKALPVFCDVRDEQSVKKAVEKAVETFGGIDIVVNNASAISLTPVSQTTSKKFDLMHQIEYRGSFLVAKYCLPWVKKSRFPHRSFLSLSPPLFLLEAKWLAPHPVYTIAKYNMSMFSLGLAEELKAEGIGSNCLWPLTTIATAAVANLLGGDKAISKSRTAEIMADSAYLVLSADPKVVTGGFFVDEKLLRAVGVTDFSKYKVSPEVKEEEIVRDFFV